MQDNARNTVERRELLPWVSECLKEGQLRLSPRQRWVKVFTNPGVPLTSTQTLVLHTLVNYMDAEGHARVSLSTLAKASKLSRRAVSDALRVLIRSGWLHYEPGRPGRANRYRGRYPTQDPGHVVVQEMPY